MSTQTSWTPAKLKVVEPSTGGPDKVLLDYDLPFNPKEFSITRGAKWKAAANKSGALAAEYNGPAPSTVTLEVFLDETTDKPPKGGGGAWGDVSRTVKEFLRFVNPTADSKSKDKPSAPHAHLIWGTAILFEGYIEQVAVKYTLFREDGTPVRGTATLTLKEFTAPEKATNPSSGGEPGSRSHTVVAGDTLASIAYAEYGTAAGWRRIADANNAIDDPMRLRPGTTLLVPPAG